MSLATKSGSTETNRIHCQVLTVVVYTRFFSAENDVCLVAKSHFVCLLVDKATDVRRFHGNTNTVLLLV